MMQTNPNDRPAPAKPGDRITYLYGTQVRGGKVQWVGGGHVRLAGLGETVAFRRILAVVA
jgi:hypothetical protein